jgi:uncharacterized protein
VTSALLLSLASLTAGAVNAMAGGGTFIAFPALTGIARLTEKAANITSTVGIWPGYAASIVAARAALRALRWRTVLVYAVIGLAGGVGGAALLLTTSVSSFAKAVPWLLAFSTLLFAAQPTIHRWADRAEGNAIQPNAPIVLAIVLTIAIYNGYFGAGGGVLLLAGMAILMPGDVRRLNALKILIQVTANASAIVVFLSSTTVDWHIVAVMGPGAIVGGFAGMRLATRISARALQGVIIVVGAALTAVYLVKAYAS